MPGGGVGGDGAAAARATAAVAAVLAAEQLGLGVLPADLLGGRLRLQGGDLRLLVVGQVAVQLPERHQVHHVQLAGLGRLLQPLEGEGAVHLQVHRLHVAALGERLDGQGVAHPHPVQIQRRRQLLVEELVAPGKVAVVHLEERRQQLADFVLLGPQLLLQLGPEHLGLAVVQLEQQLPHLVAVVAHVLLQLLVLGDGRLAVLHRDLHLVQPPGGLQLHLLLVGVLGEHEAALTAGDHLAVDHLHAVEALGIRRRVGAHVADEQHVGVGRQRGDVVLQVLEAVQRILVELRPELGRGRLLDRGDVLGRDRPFVLQLGHVGKVGLQHGDDLPDVGLLVLDGLLDVGLVIGTVARLLAPPVQIAQLAQGDVDGVAAS